MRKRTMSKRFVVEGAWLEGNDGSPVTRDFVVAEDEDAAAALVESVRGKMEPWQSDVVMEFERFIETESAILREMTTMSLQDVEASWLNTKECLGVDEGEEDEKEDEKEDDKDEEGEEDNIRRALAWKKAAEAKLP